MITTIYVAIIILPFSGPKKGDKFRTKPTKEVNWKDLLKDIEEFKYGYGGKLKKVMTDDRSKPMLAKTKKGGKVSSMLFG